jgi:hypothetical protein
MALLSKSAHCTEVPSGAAEKVAPLGICPPAHEAAPRLAKQFAAFMLILIGSDSRLLGTHGLP